MTRRRRSASEPGPTSKRVAIYTRKSTSAGLEQEFNSLDAQRDACEAYVRSQPGWKVIDEHYDDGGFTGANIDRPAFQRLLTDIEARKIDVVVVYKVDRLSRSLLDFAKVMERFDGGGCAFVSVTQNFSTADAMGRLTLNLLMSFAEFERSMIAERTRDKIAGARKRGMWTGGRPPIGYRLEEGKLVVEPHEAIVVREIFTGYVGHNSIVRIIDELTSRGRGTKQHVSRDGRLHPARRLTKDGVLRVLKNPLYAGFVRAGDELVPGQHDAIIERGTFDVVQEIMGGRRQATHGGASESYLLAGLVRCAACGYGMTPASSLTRGQTYRYYRCVTRDKQGAKGCPTKPVPGAELERIVIERLRAAACDPSLVERVAARVRERVTVARRELEEERRALSVAIGKLGVDARRAAEALGSASDSTHGHLAARLEQAGLEVQRREARLVAIAAELAALADTEANDEWIARHLASFDRLWDAMTPANRARLARTVVERVVVDQARGKIAVHLREGVAQKKRSDAA